MDEIFGTMSLFLSQEKPHCCLASVHVQTELPLLTVKCDRPAGPLWFPFLS